MNDIVWVIAAVFLPLFPLSMVFNGLFQRIQHPGLRILLMTVWPCVGVYIVHIGDLIIPDWVIYWALFSSLLYALRAVVVKDLVVWIGFLATSAWALSWVLLARSINTDVMLFAVLAFSLPLSILTLLVAMIVKRYGSAYAGVVAGLSQAVPRLSALIAISLLAAIASPLFPGFFAMLDIILYSIQFQPVMAIVVVSVWLLWSWSGVTLLQKLLVGSARQKDITDVDANVLRVFGISLLMLVVGGIYLSGVML